MKRRWFTNRVIWGLLIFLVGIGVWEFHFKPQYRPFYEEGVKRYQAGEYLDALQQFQRASDIAPNSTDVLLMLGWSNLKLHRFEVARYYFERTLQIDPRVTEARIGYSFVVLETGRGSLDVSALSRILAERPKDANVQIVAAGALVEQGQNLQAVQMYRSLLDSAAYHRAADAALRALYGLGENEGIPSGLAPVTKPPQLQVRYRAGENAIWRKTNTAWEKFYVAGVNLVPATPGFTPGLPPNDPGYYTTWLEQVKELGANTVHVYSLLPPAFYRAYERAPAGIALLQQIFFDLPPEGDLFDKPYEAAKSEIRYAIDAIHGHGDVPHRGRAGSGLYVADISAKVAGLVLGGDLNPKAAITTNLRNPEKTSFAGKFVSISGATPTEVWIAQMLDYAAQYETDTYGWQHPLAFANSPEFDPLSHPSESPATRNDVVSVDESKFRISPNLAAGLFASYSVRPYYPDFLLREARYQAAKDRQGVNPVAGYVRDLRSRVSLPLVIGEFGIPSAIGLAHVQQGNWNEGGISESQQAGFLVRMAEAIRDAGCAGGSLFELADEWYRAHGLAADFELPRDRAALWLNEMSPDSRFGLVGFHTSRWQLFAGDGSAWKNERTLYENSSPAESEPGSNLRSVQMAADEGFLYLRLNLACVECRGKPAGKAQPVSDFPRFAVAINTLPARAGVQKLPFGGIRLLPGANFLLYLGPDGGALLIASSYNPLQIVTAPGAPNNNEFRRKKPFAVTLQQEGNFEPMVLQIAEPIYGRDGIFYPAQRYSPSTLRRTQENVGKADIDSIAEWYVDTAHNAIVVRVPWGKLLVTDPSSMEVFVGLGASQEVRADVTQGVQITVFSLKGGSVSDPHTWDVAGALPAASAGVIANPQTFGWRIWNTVNPEPYRKAAFAAMQKEFSEETRTGAAPVKRASAREIGPQARKALP